MNPLSKAFSYTLKSLHRPLEIYSRYQQLIQLGDKSKIRVLSDCPYGDHPQQQADLFLPQSTPANSKTGHPIVILIHGGHWVAGDKQQYAKIAQALCSQGIIVVNLNYRLAPKVSYPEQIQDINQATQWVSHTIRSLQGDPSQLYLFGDNAGANIALTYALTLKYSYLRSALNLQNIPSAQAFKGLVLLHGLYDLASSLYANLPFAKLWQQAILGSASMKSKDSLVKLASPIQHIHLKIPPVFIGSTESDPLFDQSVMLANALKHQKHLYATSFFDKVDHPFEHHWMFSLQIKPSAKKMLQDSLNFINWRINSPTVSQPSGVTEHDQQSILETI